jgi:hypothetical protein
MKVTGGGNAYRPPASHLVGRDPGREGTGSLELDR